MTRSVRRCWMDIRLQTRGGRMMDRTDLFERGQSNPLKTFEITGIDGIIKYRKHTLPSGKNPQDLQLEYLLRDALHYSEDVTYIDLIKINGKHNNGLGSELLKAFIDVHEDEFILLNAGAIEEVKHDNELYTLIDKLTYFYEKNGFINVNHIIGFCSESIVFGYNNITLREKLNLDY